MSRSSWLASTSRWSGLSEAPISRIAREFLTDDHLLLDAGPPVGYVELPSSGVAASGAARSSAVCVGATSGYRAAAIVDP